MAFSRKCDEPSCRKRYEAKRRDSRYCSAACRQRAARKATGKPAAGKVVELVVPPVEDASSSARGDGSEASLTPVTDATRAELVEAGRLDSSLGRSALALARRLDAASVLDTGSSLGSLAKALAELLDRATRGRSVADDPVDQLRQRREERRKAARGA